MRRALAVEMPAGIADRAFRAAMAAQPDERSFLASLFPMAWRAALATSAAAALLAGWSFVSQPTTTASTDPFEQVLGTSARVESVLQGALGATEYDR
jgi:hypothetical protein